MNLNTKLATSIITEVKCLIFFRKLENCFHHTLPHPTQWTPLTDTAARWSHNG